MIKCLLTLALALLVSAASAAAEAAQGGYRPQDVVTVDRAIRFARGSNSAVVRNRIKRGAAHNYRVSARAGQEMTVLLKTRGRTSFTLNGPSGRIDDADGVNEWRGTLSDTGEYLIEIGTDTTSSYTLEVRIR